MHCINLSIGAKAMDFELKVARCIFCHFCYIFISGSIIFLDNHKHCLEAFQLRWDKVYPVTS